MKIVAINKVNAYLINDFLNNAGEKTLETFRYFEKRPLDIISNHLCTFIFVEEGLCVAYGHLDKENSTVWLGVAVAQNFLGKGYGIKMVQELINAGKQFNISKITLSVDHTNIPAKSLYEKLGFVLSKKEKSIDYYTFNYHTNINAIKNGESYK